MPITDLDHAPMRRAIEASREAVAAGNMPFGATLVAPDGTVIVADTNNHRLRKLE